LNPRRKKLSLPGPSRLRHVASGGAATAATTGVTPRRAGGNARAVSLP
jgi:hypothetical protein